MRDLNTEELGNVYGAGGYGKPPVKAKPPHKPPHKTTIKKRKTTTKKRYPAPKKPKY